MQRLTERNLAANLRLREGELLIAQGPAFPARRGIRRLRMRVELGGYAERTYHELASENGIYTHRSVHLGEAQRAGLIAALRAALDEQPGGDAADPQGCYRTIRFRDGGRSRELWVDYAQGPPGAAFAEAWAYLERLFPMVVDA